MRQQLNEPPPSRRRLLIGAGAALAVTAVAVPTALALLGGDNGTDANGNGPNGNGGAPNDGGTGAHAPDAPPTPEPLRPPPPVPLPERPRLTPLGTLTAHRDEISALRFNPDGTRLASVETFDGVLRLWDVAARSEAADPLLSSLAVFETIAFSPDGRSFAASGFLDDEIRLYDTGTRRARGEPLAVDGAYRLAFSPDGATLARVDRSGFDGLRLWDVASGAELAHPPADFGGTPEILALSPDGATLALAAGSEVRFYDPATGEETGPRLPEHRGSATGLAWSTDGSGILTADYAGLHTWSAETHARVGRVDTGGTFARFALSPDGRTLATTTFQDREIALWRLE
ncbi:WD40 repeat domain-containing protein [Streptomyces radicis]|uniref:WD40 repeat domain-containing protein n=1 Tax=Streptomyces radicis TaxID=1750517 RepID=A0A3A9WDJ3_9ACTN|nr:WD40 repeat domain-containing protein [Streptomyces radicis]RKN25113.1 WD40 repeat domain-containing protein [Streptomyces radicis]